MWSAIFKTFETTEIQLTNKAIKRLRLSAVMAMFALPCFATIEFFDLSKNVENILLVAGGISFLALMYTSIVRLANRLWIPEKYLDEAEIERKRRSGSLTNQIMIWLFSFFTLVAVLADRFGLGSVIDWTPRTFTYLFGILFMMMICVQTAIAAWMTEPLADASVKRVASDTRYPWIILGLFVLVFGPVFLMHFLT